MNLGNNLFNARKKSGLSQEIVAEKLEVSRQTISKWETDETVPDIYQAKRISKLYNLSLDELISFDVDIKEVEDIIKNSIALTINITTSPTIIRIIGGKTTSVYYHFLCFIV